MSIVLASVIETVLFILNIYLMIVLTAVVVSWLIAFKIINMSNDFVATVVDFLHRITEPVLAPIRRMLPDLGGIDISPVVLLLLIYFLQTLLSKVAVSLS